MPKESDQWSLDAKDLSQDMIRIRVAAIRHDGIRTELPAILSCSRWREIYQSRYNSEKTFDGCGQV